MPGHQSYSNAIKREAISVLKRKHSSMEFESLPKTFNIL